MVLRGRAAAWLAIAVLAVVGLPAVVAWSADVAATWEGRREVWDASDFGAFYAAGELVAGGRGEAIYDVVAVREAEREYIPSREEVLPYLNPPFFAGAMAVWALWSFDVAYRVWTVVNVALLAAVVVVVWRCAGGLGSVGRSAAVALVVANYAVAYGVRQGQFSLLLVLAFAWSGALLRSRRDGWAGVAWSALLVKPELVVPLCVWALWRRRWGVFHTLVPLAALLVLVSVAIVGVGGAVAYPAYLGDVAAREQPGTAVNVMYGWVGLVGGVFGAGSVSWAIVVHGVLASLGVAAGVGWWDDARFARSWLVLVLAAVLGDPHLYLQDVVVVVPAFVVWGAGVEGRMRWVFWLVMVAGWFVLGEGEALNRLAHVNVFAVLLAGGFVALLAARLPSVAGNARQLVGVTT